MVDGLRGMMRLVVTSGTAERIEDQGEVYGKTGEAEVEGGSHAWFVGYRGDLAFATLVVRGGSSDNAVAVTRDMFAALPEGY
jgi:cell division protein FtsI/penicillin-binding protein 2